MKEGKPNRRRKTLRSQMKVLYFFLGLVLLSLSACGGEAFGPELIGSGPAAGEAGQTEPLAAAGAPDAIGAAGAAGVTDEPTGAAGAAGTPSASGGSPSVAGASSGGTSAGTGGAPPTPIDPPCSPATNVSNKVSMALGTIAWCLKTNDDLDHLACTNWDTREIRVNDRVVRCGVKFTAGPRASDGYNYLQIAPGTSDQASIDWSVI